MTVTTATKLPRVLLLALSVSPIFAACGASVQHAPRATDGPPAREPVLVQIVDSAPLEARVVSMTRYEIHPSDTLPTEAPDGVKMEMREEAARAGAESLLIERLNTPWKRAFFGLGLHGTGAAPPRCEHPAFVDASQDASASIERCLRSLQKKRPALKASMTIMFQVNAFGDVMRAAATPESSRDGQARACGLEAVFKTDFGTPAGFVCRGRVAAATQ
jgi:hypothetical protein